MYLLCEKSLNIHLKTILLFLTLCQSLDPLVIHVEPLDVVVQGVDGGGGQVAGLPHPAAQGLAEATAPVPGKVSINTGRDCTLVL